MPICTADLNSRGVGYGGEEVRVLGGLPCQLGPAVPQIGVDRQRVYHGVDPEREERLEKPAEVAGPLGTMLGIVGGEEVARRLGVER